MIIIDSEMNVMYDVDDTLIKWSDKYSQPHEGALEFFDPYDNSSAYLTPHKKHINLLKKHKGQGYRIIVWSAGGYKWAESVVNTLRLQDYVDVVMSKPVKYVDDLPAAEVLGTRIYLNEEE